MRPYPSHEYAMSTRTRQDWILWAQLGCALVATAHAEYSLAAATGLHWSVACSVPGALDLYVIRALQKHKDVLPAVLVMVAANVASILVAQDVLPVNWAVLAAVGALAPLLVWRGHVLRVHAGAAPSTPQIQEVQAPGAVSAPEVPAWTPGYHLDGCDGVHEYEGPVNCADRVHVLASVPAHVPAWMSDEYPVPHLAPVPDLPDGYEPGPASAPVLEAGDLAYLELAREYLADAGTGTVRGLKEYASVGQARASRLLKYVEHERTVKS